MQLNDWLTATLSILTIVLGVLGVLIAVLAIWGYRGIKDEVRGIADATAKAHIDTYLNSQEIQDKLKEEIRKRIEKEADRLFADISLGSAFPQAPGAEPSGKIGEEYPIDGDSKDD